MMQYVLPLLVALFAATARADDGRQLATLPEPAQAVLRQEMRDNLTALNDIVSLLAAGKMQEAGEAAESRLGTSAMGKHRSQPFEARPGPHMPPAMHALGMDGHRAASEFARIAASGDREAALAALPKVTGACVACHAAWRIR